MDIVWVFILVLAGWVAWYKLNRRVTLLTREVDVLRAALATAGTPEAPAAEPLVPPAPEPQKAPESQEEAETPEAVLGWNVRAPKAPRAETAAGTPEKAGGGIEQALGTKWTVWVGGLALAFGAIFLVQYSVQQGFFGPGLRIFLGALVAAALLAAGELLRRRPDLARVTRGGAVPIPPILTAAGSIAAYATIYAAYALYGMMSGPVAFVLLGFVSVAAILLSGVHASYLAGIGLLGSVLTPALVQSETPNPEILFLYLTFVIGAAIATADLRNWRWLNYAALAATAIWPLIWLVALWQPGDEIIVMAHLLALYAFQFFWKWGDAEEAKAADIFAPPAMSAALTGFLIMLFLFAADYEDVAIAGLAIYVALSVAAGWARPGFVAATAVSSPLAVASLGLWAIPRAVWERDPSISITHFFTQPLLSSELTAYLTASAIAGLVYAGAGYLKLASGARHKGWAAAATFTPLALFIIAYARTELLATSVGWAGLALLLAIAHGAATQQLDRRRRGTEPGDFAIALYACATLGFLALTFAIAFRNEWLTIALAALVPGIASVRRYFDQRILEKLAIVVAGTVFVRLVFNPYLPDYEIGTTPVFNMLLYTYGLPTFFIAAGAWMFRKQTIDKAADYLEQVAIVLGLVLIHLEINHVFNHGDAFDLLDDYGLGRHGAFVIVWIGAAMLLMRQRLIHDRVHYRWMAAILRGLSYAGLFVGIFLMSPLWWDYDFTEPPFLDRMMTAYLAPALIAVLCVAMAQKLGERGVRRNMTLAAAISGFAYFSLEIRRLFHQGSIALSGAPVSEAESYTYSAAWLLLGAALLWAAFLTNRQVLRIASLCLIMLVVAKVFLLDMSGLSGIWRAASFLGLGVALIGVGLFYQRVVFRKESTAE